MWVQTSCYDNLDLEGKWLGFGEEGTAIGGGLMVVVSSLRVEGLPSGISN